MFDEVSAAWSQCAVISRQILRLVELPQEFLLISYLLVSRFSINFSEGFRLLLDQKKNLADSVCEDV